jgi:hypothetical protein
VKNRRVIKPVAALVAAITIQLSGVVASAAQTPVARPYSARSGSAERMMFTAIPVSESGLVTPNEYDDPAMWGARYMEFSTGAIGSGVAVGDLMRDGTLYVFVANKTRPSQLFKQVAPFKFVDVTESAGVGGPAAVDGAGWKTGVTMADVNNDGFLDIYVCRYNAPNLLYMNDGRGHFTESASMAGV